MGGIAKELSNITGKLLGSTPKASVPKTPDLEAEQKKAEAEAVRRRAALAEKGMSGTVLGGSYGSDANVTRKKLLGE